MRLPAPSRSRRPRSVPGLTPLYSVPTRSHKQNDGTQARVRHSSPLIRSHSSGVARHTPPPSRYESLPGLSFHLCHQRYPTTSRRTTMMNLDQTLWIVFIFCAIVLLGACTPTRVDSPYIQWWDQPHPPSPYFNPIVRSRTCYA